MQTVERHEVYVTPFADAIGLSPDAVGAEVAGLAGNRFEPLSNRALRGDEHRRSRPFVAGVSCSPSLAFRP